ncbi:MAG: MBL fold metallo-hydrolase [Candidatus Helarchaeota archaeon]
MNWIQEEVKLNENTYLIDSILFGTEKSMACYLVKGTKKNVLIDASGKSEGRRIAKKLLSMDLKPDILIITHSHWDHAGGASKLVKKFPNIEIMVHKSGIDSIANPNEFNKWFPQYSSNLEPINDSIPLDDGDIIDIGDSELKILSTPGHTNCSICILDNNNNNLFTGDSIGYKLSEEVFLGPIMPPEYSEKNLMNTFNKLKKINFSTVSMAHFGYITGNLAENLIDSAKSNYLLWKNFMLLKWKENPDIKYIEQEMKKELIKKNFGLEMAEIVSEMFSDWIIKGLETAKMI